MLFSAIQQSESVLYMCVCTYIYIYIYMLFKILFLYSSLQNVEKSSPYYTVGPYYFTYSSVGKRDKEKMKVGKNLRWRRRLKSASAKFLPSEHKSQEDFLALRK